MYENYEGNHEIPVNEIKEQRERNPVALEKGVNHVNTNSFQLDFLRYPFNKRVDKVMTK